ncbi:DUF4880 domain-containing protein [Pseudomonas putida]|nr:DUF4880 domain-containing protein [Pseudomonas putida]
MAESAINDPVAQQAIQWLVQLHSGEMTDAERRAFEKWRAEHPSHELACRRIEQTLGHLPGVAREPGLRKVLHSNGTRRQFLQGALAITALASSSAWLYDRHSPLGGVFADLSTGTGERKTVTLQDGSVLTLNARSSVDVQVTASMRQIQLIKGMMHLRAARAATPFVISTDAGLVSLEEGALTVGVKSDGTQVAALSEAASITTRAGRTQLVAAGQGAVFDSQSYNLHAIAVSAESAWLEGYVQINDQPLSVLIDALRDYRTGILRVSPDVANLRISGIFPLDDTDYALDALAQTMPVVVRRTTGYWVSISKA